MANKPIPEPIPVAYVLKIPCGNCGGSGSKTINPAKWYDENGDPVNPTTEICTVCNGNGKVIFGEVVVA
jgi:DnaJ-class molecular chaperone